MAELFDTPNLLGMLFDQRNTQTPPKGNLIEDITSGFSAGQDAKQDYLKDKTDWEQTGKIGPEPSLPGRFFGGNTGYTGLPAGTQYSNNGIQSGKVLDSTVEFVAGISSAVAKRIGYASD